MAAITPSGLALSGAAPAIDTAQNPGHGLLFGSYRTPEQEMAQLAIFSQMLSGQTPQEQLNFAPTLIPLQQAAQAKQLAAQTKNQTVAMLQQKSPELAAAVASGAMTPGDALGQLFKQEADAKNAAKYQFVNVNGHLVRTNAVSGEQTDVGNYTNPNANIPVDARTAAYWQSHPEEYQTYLQQQKDAAALKNSNRLTSGQQEFNAEQSDPKYAAWAAQRRAGQLKPPAGFQWKDPADPSQGLEPIKGGPGEQIPAEVAARIGIADNFQKQLPDIKKSVAKGDVTGAFDRPWISIVGTGDGANTYRQIQSGVDALARMLTGAGMNETEAKNYASRYLPSYTDDAKTVNEKLDQLSGELDAAKAQVMRGRGGDQTQPQTTTPATSGKTSTGLNWSVQ